MDMFGGATKSIHHTECSPAPWYVLGCRHGTDRTTLSSLCGVCFVADSYLHGMSLNGS